MTHLLSSLKALLMQWLSLGVIVLPSALKIPIYRHVFGYKIGRHVKIGLSWIKVGKLEIGDYVTIGHFNRFKHVPEVIIQDYTGVGFGNTFTSTFEFTNEQARILRGNHPVLSIGKHCGITMFHHIDVQDTFTIGSYTTVAGRSSVFYTHYLDVIRGTQSTKPISIGAYCMIGSNVRFVPGASVPDCCVVGMAAVITNQFGESHTLLGGNPATVIRRLPHDAAYFTRTVGFVAHFVRPPYEGR